MATTYNHENFKVPITTQAKFDAASAAGTLIEGLPYYIQTICPEIQYGSAVPTTSTTCSNIGDLYIATTTGAPRVFQCVALLGTSYTWREMIRDVQLNGASMTSDGVGNILTQSDYAVITAGQKVMDAYLASLIDTRLTALESQGRFLAMWNASTGLPVTFPTTELPYTYRTGDSYTVGTVATSGNNYRPSGATYTGDPSTTVETSTITVGGQYIWDGANWNYVQQSGSIAYVAGYYDSTTKEFYYESTHTTIITKSTQNLYIDIPTTTLFRYDGTDYIKASIAVINAYYHEGHFYKEEWVEGGTHTLIPDGNSDVFFVDITTKKLYQWWVDQYTLLSGSGTPSDEKTIVTNTDGKIETAVGGWKEVVGTETTYHPLDTRFIPTDGTIVIDSTETDLPIGVSLDKKTLNLNTVTGKIETAVGGYKEGSVYHTIDGRFIPIDNVSIVYNEVTGKISSAGGTVAGYLHNGNFYKDFARTELIVPDTKYIYIDLTTNDRPVYRYTGTEYQIFSDVNWDGKQGIVGRTVGGVSAGDDLTGKTIHQIFTKMFEGYLAPEVNYTFFELDPNTPKVEYGTSTTVSSITIDWTNGTTERLDTMSLSHSAWTDPIEVSEPTTPYTFDILSKAVTISGADEKVFTLTLNDGSGDPRGTVTKNVTIKNTYDYPYYMGVTNKTIETITIADVQAAGTKLGVGLPESGTFTTTVGGTDRPFFATTKKIAKITDANGFDYTNTHKMVGPIALSSADPGITWGPKDFYVYVGPSATATDFKYYYTFES